MTTTFDYLKGRPFAPRNEEWPTAVARWKSFASDPDATYDDIVTYDALPISRPTVTWGINPGQAIFIDEEVPLAEDLPKRIAPLLKRLSLICT